MIWIGVAMQKMMALVPNSALTAFDSAFRRAYPNPYALPFSRQCDVLLLPDAGVWVGLTEIHPTHPANAGGFHFIRHLEAGSRAGPTFEILKIEFMEETDDYRDRKRNLQHP